MKLSAHEIKRILQLWSQHEQTLMMVLDKQLEEYTASQARQTTEWETLRQGIEYTAKKQALIDLKNLLSKRYDTTDGE